MSDDTISDRWLIVVTCTCDHELSQHRWGWCDVEGCDCEGDPR